MSHCAPGRKAAEWTCFRYDELKSLVDAWNHTSPGREWPISLGKGSGDRATRKLWSELHDRFEPFCGENESCWLDNTDIRRNLRSLSPELYDAIIFFVLKPKGTRGSDDWLSTIEIDRVLLQYEEIFQEEFRYIGCKPSDFFHLHPEEFPFDEISGFPKSALIFNLDASHQQGSHWVAIFFDKMKSGRLLVEYFDATGRGPNRNIRDFLKHPFFDEAVIRHSTKRHQRQNNECGVYAIYFVLQRLRGKTLSTINGRFITDKEMNRFRAEVFRPFSEDYSFGD